MLNQPTVEGEDLNDIIDYRLDELVSKMHKEGYEIKKSDIRYSFFDRIEELFIPSELLYGEDIDIPAFFGVHRGYGGGGVHTALTKTEINHLPERRQGKADRMLEYFKETFWAVLKDADSATEDNTGEEVEAWHSVQI